MEQTNALTTNPAPGFLVVAIKDLAIMVAIPMAIPKATAPKKRRKTAILRISKEVTKFAVFWNKHQRPPGVLPDQSFSYDCLHNCNTWSTPAGKDMNHANTRPPVANSCEVQPPQPTQRRPTGCLETTYG